MNSQSKNYCLYHGPDCSDGFIAAWSVYYHLGDSCEYIPINYGQDVRNLDLEPGSTIYIVDFCPPPEQVIDLGRQHEKVVVIDHHEHACNEIIGFREILPENVILHLSANNEKSGALLTWEFFQEMLSTDKYIPKIVLAASDYDTWRFEYDFSLAYYYFIAKLPRTVETMKALTYNREFDNHNQIMLSCLPIANAMVSNMDWIIKNTKRDFQFGILLEEKFLIPHRHNVALFNTPHFMVSLTLDRYLRQSGDVFAMSYFDTEEKRVFRLNSRKEKNYDVSKIAREFGGGGHPGSASFSVPRDHWLAKI